MTAIFFVSVFRKATDLFKNNNEKKVIIKVENTRKFARVDAKSFQVDQILPSAESELRNIRMDRLKEKKIKNIIKKAFLHSMFLWILYVTAFSNRDLNTHKYQASLKETMCHVKTAASRIDSVIFYFIRAITGKLIGRS